MAQCQHLGAQSSPQNYGTDLNTAHEAFYPGAKGSLPLRYYSMARWLRFIVEALVERPAGDRRVQPSGKWRHGMYAYTL